MRRAAPVAALGVCGAAWGLTLPLLRVAVSTGYPPLGLILWHKAIMAGVLGALLVPLRLAPPLRLRHLGLFAAVAVFGAILPGYFTFLTAAELPAGVRALVIAVVPMFALPMALALGFERPDPRRALGVMLGALAVALIAMPGAGLPPAASAAMILLALLSPLSYGIEANYLAWRGSDGLHPFQLLFGAALVGIALTWPLAAATGQVVSLAHRWGAVEWAVLLSGLLNALAYSGYVWLVGRGGSVFASQISYLVTAFGVLWSMALLGERYSLWVWAAFVLMLGGIALVQPRPARAQSP
jgi:drug/metabolite transporter (DMT)-like permease